MRARPRKQGADARADAHAESTSRCARGTRIKLRSPYSHAMDMRDMAGFSSRSCEQQGSPLLSSPLTPESRLPMIGGLFLLACASNDRLDVYRSRLGCWQVRYARRHPPTRPRTRCPSDTAHVPTPMIHRRATTPPEHAPSHEVRDGAQAVCLVSSRLDQPIAELQAVMRRACIAARGAMRILSHALTC